MKKSFLIMVALMSLTTFAFAGGDQNQNRQDGEIGEGPTQQQRIANPNLDALQVTQLDATLKGIIYSIYEEEKVARDVYRTLGGIYSDENTFANIQLAEQNHMDAVRKLCVKYGIPIPVSDKTGEFTLDEMKEIYEGSVDDEVESLIAALQAGINIELIDIADLTNALLYLAPQGVPRDIQNVLSNLINGSYNHLEAFQDALARESAQ